MGVHPRYLCVQEGKRTTPDQFYNALPKWNQEMFGCNWGASDFRQGMITLGREFISPNETFPCADELLSEAADHSTQVDVTHYAVIHGALPRLSNNALAQHRWLGEEWSSVLGMGPHPIPEPVRNVRVRSRSVNSIDPDQLATRVCAIVKESIAEDLAEIGLTKGAVKLLIAAASSLSDQKLLQRSNGDPDSADEAPIRTTTLKTAIQKLEELSDTQGTQGCLVDPVRNPLEKSSGSIGRQAPTQIGQELPPSLSASQLTFPAPLTAPNSILSQVLPTSMPPQLHVDVISFKAPLLDDPVDSSARPADIPNRSAARPYILMHTDSFEQPVAPPSIQPSLALPGLRQGVANSESSPRAPVVTMPQSNRRRHRLEGQDFEPRPSKKPRRSLACPDGYCRYEEEKGKESLDGAGTAEEGQICYLSDSQLIVPTPGCKSNSRPPATFTLEDGGTVLTRNIPRDWFCNPAQSTSCANLRGMIQRITGNSGGREKSAAQMAAMLLVGDQTLQQDMMVTLPTGGGKSLLWLAPPLADLELKFIVVCPFAVLLDEQADRARKAGLKAVNFSNTERNVLPHDVQILFVQVEHVNSVALNKWVPFLM